MRVYRELAGLSLMTRVYALACVYKFLLYVDIHLSIYLSIHVHHGLIHQISFSSDRTKEATTESVNVAKSCLR